MVMYKRGDLVLAKMKGFPVWPGIVTAPPPHLKKKPMKRSAEYYCIYFFGSNNYSWIESNKLQSYNTECAISKRYSGLQEAHAAISAYRETGEGGSNFNITTNSSNELTDDCEAAPTVQMHNATMKMDETDSDANTVDCDQSHPSSDIDTEPLLTETTDEEDIGAADQSDQRVVDYTNDSSSSTKSNKNERIRKVAKAKPFLQVPVPTRRRRHHTLNRRQTGLRLTNFSPSRTPPSIPQMDLGTMSNRLLNRRIIPSLKRIGFIGLGLMGSRMVKHLLNSGHRVIVCDIDRVKANEFVGFGSEIAYSPQEVCAAADIIFSYMTEPQSSKFMLFSNEGILDHMNSSKAFVELSNIDKSTSLKIAAAVTARGARYLEAQIQGSTTEAENSSLLLLAAGDISLYNDCLTCFQAFGNVSFYLGEVGNATKMNTIIQILSGVQIAVLAEALALADKCGLNQSDLLDVISLGPWKSQFIKEKGKLIADCSFSASMPLDHLKTDMKLALKLGEEYNQPLPLTSVAHQIYKQGKRNGYGQHDATAVYLPARFN